MNKENDTSASRVDSIGRLIFEGERTLCYLCGKWYVALGTHIAKAHGWFAADYREEFGLNKYQPLCSPEYSRRCALRPQCKDMHIKKFCTFQNTFFVYTFVIMLNKQFDCLHRIRWIRHVAGPICHFATVLRNDRNTTTKSLCNGPHRDPVWRNQAVH